MGEVADDRRVDSDRLELRPPERLRAALLARYPIEEFPSLDSEQDVWVRAAEDALRKSECGTDS